jgi:hypothetical protein
VDARLPNDCAFFALGDVCACTSEDMLGQCVCVCVCAWCEVLSMVLRGVGVGATER